ncbi:MAG TPA: hypothetical protein VFJ74_01170 [Gemmatimonadaceae bacterium]|nr:hypothetical protein [Gemmatimonadaceae bacterium]
MTRLSKLYAATAAAAVFAAPLATAHAQEATTTTAPASRFAVELYLAQYSVETEASSRTGLGGFGARVMFGHSDATNVLRTFFNRARAGAFITYTAKQKENDVATTHVGAQADFPLLATPMNGYLDPFVSLGAGVFHASTTGSVAGTNTTSNDFALTPAVGTLIPITGAISFRGDLRDVVIFGQNKTTNNFLAEGGISIGF